MKKNKDFIKDSFYLHSETRAKCTDEMKQMTLMMLIVDIIKEEKEIKEKEMKEDSK